MSARLPLVLLSLGAALLVPLGAFAQEPPEGAPTASPMRADRPAFDPSPDAEPSERPAGGPARSTMAPARPPVDPDVADANGEEAEGEGASASPAEAPARASATGAAGEARPAGARAGGPPEAPAADDRAPSTSARPPAPSGPTSTASVPLAPAAPAPAAEPEPVLPDAFLGDAGVPDESALEDEADAGVPLDAPADTTGAASGGTTSAPAAQGGPGTIVVQVPPTPSPQQFVQVPVPMPMPSTDFGQLWDAIDDITPGLPMTQTTGFGVLVLLVFVLWGLGHVAGRARERLAPYGLLPALLSFAHLVLRMGALATCGLAVVYLVPPELLPVITFVLIAAGAAVGWSARDVLVDYVAGLVLLFERRLRRGTWISFGDHAGMVEKVGVRATWLRDSMGHRVAVPNRELLRAPLLIASMGVTEQEVTLRIEADAEPNEIREALRDAVLASPWVFAGVAPVVLRDPQDPSVWRVRSRLLHAQYMVSFEGQLLERAEEMLAERRRARRLADDAYD